MSSVNILTLSEQRRLRAVWFNQTSNKNPNKHPTYYMMLKKPVLDYVKHYTADFTQHDREFFRKNPFGCFLYGMRETGTDIINLDKEVWLRDREGKEYTKEDTKEAKKVCKLWLTNHNKRFFLGYTLTGDKYCKPGEGIRTLTEITKEDCIRYIDSIEVETAEIRAEKRSQLQLLERVSYA